MRDAPYDTDTLEFEGLEVHVKYYYDFVMEPPWENDCGRGEVRKTINRHREGDTDKRPGERPLNQPGRNEYQFYYDHAEATQRARADGWNTEPYDAPNQVARAVEADFQFIRAFLNNDWHYVGIVCEIHDDEGEVIAEDACWGFETYKNYHKTAAREMAESLAKSYRKQQDKELSEMIKEQVEAQYWAERDVVTK